MNKTNKYYVDQDGNMAYYVNKNMQKQGQFIEISAKAFHEKLEIVDFFSYLGYGLFFTLKNKDGRLYSMNADMLRRYLMKNSIAVEADWDFYQQGAMYSIGPKLG